MNRILLLLEMKENQRLLAEALAPRYEIIHARNDDALDEDFDLCILDGQALDRLWDRVHKRKQESAPAFLPFLLVTARKDVRHVTRHLWRTVDELILTPIEKVELQARVEILLRARRHSHEQSARLKAEAALEAITQVLERVSDGFVVLDKNWNCTYLNQKGAQLLNRQSPADLLGKNYWEEYPEAAGTPFAQAYQRAMEEQVTIVLEDYYAPWDRWFENRIYPSPDGISIFFTEITERVRAEEKLRESEARFRDLYENAPIAYFSVEVDGRIRRCNRRAEELTGYAAEELVGRSVLDLYADTPQGKEKATKVLERFRAGEPVREEELQLQRADGTLVWISLTVSAVRDAQGRVVESRSMAVDITARVQAEEALRQSRERLNHLFAVNPAMVYELDPENFSTTWVSPNVTEITGYTPEEVRQPGLWAAHVHPEDWEDAKKAQERLMVEDRVAHEYRFQKKDGTYIWVRDELRLLRDEQGKPTEIVGSWMNITDRKEAEIALAKSEQRYRSVVENTGTAMLIINEDNSIAFANKQCTATTGYSPEELQGTDWRNYVSADDLPMMENYFRLRFTDPDKAPNRYETRLIHADGSTRNCVLTADTIPSTRQVVVSILDITERVQAEEKLKAANQQLEANYQQLIATEQALRESEEKFRLAFQNSPDSINITRLSDGKLLEASNGFEKITGHKLSDALGKKTTDLNLWANPGDREFMKEKLSRDGRIENFEFIRKMKNGDTAFSVMSAAIITINNEPHLLSVIRDVDDLKKAEIRLRENEARLKEAEILAKMGNFTWDIKSGDVTWSDGLHVMLGYDKSEKIDYNRVNAEIHHPDDLERITVWLNECIASGKTSFSPNEYRLLCKDGKVIHVQTTIKVQYENNVPIKMFGTVQDITERVQAEEALREQEHFISAIINTSPALIYVFDMEKQTNVYSSSSLERILGYSQQEIEAMGADAVESLIHPDDLARIGAFQQQIAAASDDDVLDIEYWVRDADGNWRTIHSFERPFLRNNDGLVMQKVGVALDVTEQKKAEEALKESELKFQKIISESFAGISVVNEEGRIIVWNTALEKITGIKSTETIDRYIWDVEATLIERETTGTKRKEEIKSTILDILKTGEGPWLNKMLEREYVHPDGTVKLVSGSMYTIKTQRGYLIVSISEDVTERVQAEKALRESEERYRLMLNTTLDGFILADEEGRILQVNPGYCDMIGYSEQELLSMNIRNIEARLSDQEVTERIQQMVSQGKARFETRHRAKDGRLIDLEVSISVFQSGDKPLVAAFVRDITERKRAEEALKASENRLKQAEKIAHLGHWELDLINNVLIWSDEVFRIFDLKPQEFEATYEAFLDHIHPDDREKVNEAYTNSLKTKTNYEIEHRLLLKNGEIKYVLEKCNTTYDDTGKPIRSLGTVQDITERVQAQKELQRSETLFRAITEQSGEGLSLADNNGNYVKVNPAFCKITGYSEEELLTMNVRDLVPPETEIKLFPQVRNGKSGKREAVLQRKDGSRFIAEINGYPIQLMDQNLVLGIVRDITERKRAEEELRQHRDRLAELSRRLAEARETEQRALGRELHDQFGQMLTALKLTLEIAAQLPPEETNRKIEQARQIADELLGRVRALSLELRPPMLDDLGLQSALLWLVNHYEQTSGIEVAFKQRGLEGAHFDTQIETAAYRIAQEGFTNAARHAQATRVRLEVRVEAGRMHIEIEDDGVGFDPQTAPTYSRGLVGMRERAELVGGTFRIESHIGRGTRILVLLPVENRS